MSDPITADAAVMSSKAPKAKVAAAGAGGIFATILVAAAHAVGLDLSPEVAAAVVTLASFVAGYLKRGEG